MEPDNRDFLELLKKVEAAVTALLATLGRRLGRAILQYSRRPRRLQAEIDRLIGEYVDGYRVVVTDAVATAAGLQAEKNKRALLPLLLRAGARQEEAFMRGRFDGYEEEIRRRFPTQRHLVDRRTFEQRVLSVRRGFQETVYRMVQAGVDNGTDPRRMAYLLRDFVVMTPDSQPTKAYTEAARLRNQASTYVYKGAPRGSVQYNSMRIVRTEMAGIYRRSVTDFYGDRPYTEGFDWVLSNRHPRLDQCNGFAERSPYASSGDLPQSHPQCLCRTVARVMSQAQIMRLIASGQLD